LQQPKGFDASADDVLNGKWAVSTPQTAERFFGVPFFFARRLLTDTGSHAGALRLGAIPCRIFTRCQRAAGKAVFVGHSLRDSRRLMQLRDSDLRTHWGRSPFPEMTPEPSSQRQRLKAKLAT
jgi:hypothetical protein